MLKLFMYHPLIVNFCSNIFLVHRAQDENIWTKVDDQGVVR